MVPPIARVIRASSACIRIFYGTAYDNPGYPWPWPANDFIGSDCCANGRHSSLVFCRNGATRVPTKMSALFSSARQKCRNRSFLFSSLRVCVFFFFFYYYYYSSDFVSKKAVPLGFCRFMTVFMIIGFSEPLRLLFTEYSGAARIIFPRLFSYAKSGLSWACQKAGCNIGWFFPSGRQSPNVYSFS